MGINKVEYGDETLIDLTNDTVSEDTVLEGVSFHSADGEERTGKVITSPVFIGTRQEYEEALAKGEIPEGCIVNITDDFTPGGGGSEQLTGTLCCIGDSFTEGTRGGFLDDTFEELPNYSTIRTNQSQYRTYPWWIAKLNPGLTVKNFALGQSVITRGNLSSSDPWYSKCFGVGSEVSGITDNFSYQNIPFADVYFIQFGINDCQCQKNGKQMGIKESFSLTNKLLLERSLVMEQYRTDDYTTDFNNPSYIPATFAEGISAIVNKCRMINPKARIVWLISELTLDHATYNIIVTLCNFHGIDYIDMCKVWGCMQSNRKDVTLEGVYTSTVTPKDDSFVVATTQKTRSGSLNNVLYAAVDAHPNALAHQLKGEWLSKWLNKNV